jgi:GNAT superfamily N-acetyltransferase
MNAIMPLEIRPLHLHDKSDWVALYHGYADHYQVSLTEKGLAATWDWLMDDDHPSTGLVAVKDGQVIGLAHYRGMPSPLRGIEIGFLDDLFVEPDNRGERVGEFLLKALKDIAKERDWPVIRWITRDDNYRARSLYDRVAVKFDWNTYEMLTDT